jgi:hypothetical protein
LPLSAEQTPSTSFDDLTELGFQRRCPTNLVMLISGVAQLRASAVGAAKPKLAKAPERAYVQCRSSGTFTRQALTLA